MTFFLANKSSGEVKVFNSLLDAKTNFPNFYGNVHALVCPVKSQSLIDEILCSPNAKKYTTPNLVIYSGYILNTYLPKIYITCIDMVIDNSNLLENVDTKYLWHGKCFSHPVPFTSEPLLNHETTLDLNETSATYSIKSNGTTYYRASLLGLNHSSYRYDAIPNDVFFSTQHVHRFEKFSNNRREDFCQLNQSTAIMNINFGQMYGAYYTKLANLDNIFIHENFKDIFGIKTSFTKNDLDGTNCAASFWIGIKYMNTIRAVDVFPNVSTPVSSSVPSLSLSSDFPVPFNNMSQEAIKNLTLLKSQSRYNVNEKIMEFLNVNANNLASGENKRIGAFLLVANFLLFLTFHMVL